MSEDLSLYYQRTNKAKKKLIVVLSVLLVMLAGFVYYLYRQDVSYQVQNEICLEVKSDLRIKDVLKEVKGGKIVNGQEYFNTDQLGNFEIEAVFENHLGRKTTETIKYSVIDTQKPDIEMKMPYIFVYSGATDKDIIDQIKVSDNADNLVTTTISGEYDLNSIGTYLMKAKAIDSSGNETITDFTLIVEQHFSNESNRIDTFTTSNGHFGMVKNGITYIDGYLIANKTYTVPKELNTGIPAFVQNKFNQMASDAKKDGVTLSIISGYRSYDRQISIYTRWYKQQGQAKADTHSARPGHSEHQSGFGMDLNSLETSFANTKEYKWLQENCYKYGLILRYIKGKADQTGYGFEPWHYRYVGVDLATKLYNDGDWISVEEYFGIDSQYNYDFKAK